MPVLVGQPDSGKGEHPVHANDIPQVQRAVFRGYQRADPDERVTHGAPMQGRTRTCPPSSLSLFFSFVCKTRLMRAHDQRARVRFLLYRVFVANRSRSGCEHSKILERKRGGLRKIEDVFEIFFFFEIRENERNGGNEWKVWEGSINWDRKSEYELREKKRGVKIMVVKKMVHLFNQSSTEIVQIGV